MDLSSEHGFETYNITQIKDIAMPRIVQVDLSPCLPNNSRMDDEDSKSYQVKEEPTLKLDYMAELLQSKSNQRR